ncbi:MAG: ABC transporter permease subunit [Planctomycetaceae bacterium]|nr:ABC transporter permease subunit [Planctomycetaceae bacterium]
MNMGWLLWKEYRQNRFIVYAALAILLGPYLIGFGALYGWRLIYFPMRVTPPDWTNHCLQVLTFTNFYSLSLSLLSIALIGGNAISGERVDRSSEFLFSLPLRRSKILISKFLLAALVIAVIWLLNGSIALKMPKNTFDAGILPILGVSSLVIFCSAWFFSSLVTSPAFDVCGGLITPFLVVLGIHFTAWLLTPHGAVSFAPGYNIFFFRWYLCMCCVIAPVCFCIGTWRYLRRVEP